MILERTESRSTKRVVDIWTREGRVVFMRAAPLAAGARSETMTAKGKINASRVQAGDRILVQKSAYHEGHAQITHRKTGEGVHVARVTFKEFDSRTRTYTIYTTSGVSSGHQPIQTMWLAPEDAAGVKRAHVEALAEIIAEETPVETEPAQTAVEAPGVSVPTSEPVTALHGDAGPVHAAIPGLAVSVCQRYVRGHGRSVGTGTLTPVGRYDLATCPDCLAAIRAAEPLPEPELNDLADAIVQSAYTKLDALGCQHTS